MHWTLGAWKAAFRHGSSVLSCSLWFATISPGPITPFQNLGTIQLHRRAVMKMERDTTYGISMQQVLKRQPFPRNTQEEGSWVYLKAWCPKGPPHTVLHGATWPQVLQNLWAKEFWWETVGTWDAPQENTPSTGLQNLSSKVWVCPGASLTLATRETEAPGAFGVQTSSHTVK